MEIRRSCIDNRFYGAFASKDIAVNTVIGQYKGVICNKNDSLSQYKHSIGRDVVIDSSNFLSCHGRYINDCVLKVENVRMKVLYAKKRIDIITTKNISKNDELVTDYGPEYWEGNAALMHDHDKSKGFSLKIALSKKRIRSEEADEEDV